MTDRPRRGLGPFWIFGLGIVLGVLLYAGYLALGALG
jgi:hypothetical protein